jgi:hypothetical protein
MNTIRSQPGFHVRLGTQSGSGKRLRQKEVDVQLAVDMLTHAFAKNMSRATLIAGDLDFRPVVNSLIQLGTYVELRYGRKSAADELRWSADESRELTIDDLYYWTTAAFQKSHHPLPRRTGVPRGSISGRQIKSGNLDGAAVRHCSDSMDAGSPFTIYIDGLGGNDAVAIVHSDKNFLELYVQLTEGKILWD